MATLTQIDSFKLGSMSSFLKLQSNDEEKLVKCINTYKGPFYFNILTRVWDAVCSIFGGSAWQKATKALHPYVYSAVEREYSSEPKGVMEKRAAALTEFVVRFLITDAPLEAKNKQFYIDKDLYEGGVNSRCKSDYLERATYGNGKRLGKSPREDLINSVVKMRNEFEANATQDAFLKERASAVIEDLKKDGKTKREGVDFSEAMMVELLRPIYADRLVSTQWVMSSRQAENATMRELGHLLLKFSVRSVLADVKEISSACT